ncbi:hypothetical protein [Rhizobium sp. R693]|nr:hypothetical protein [Rhizobium sp. R693]
MVVFDDRRIALRDRRVSAAADTAAPVVTILAFAFLFAITLGVL